MGSMNACTPLFVLKLYALTVPVFLLVDFLWLGWVARTFYRSQLGALLRVTPNWTAAILFYLLYVAGILLFVVCPALDRGSLARAGILGGLFGLMAYATYDLTNLATVPGWPLRLVLVDIAWGICLTAIVSVISFAIGRWLH
jgi:uncharacterized membrane protein